MRTKRFIIVNIFVLAISLMLSSCLCHPFESRLMLMQEKVDSMIGISNYCCPIKLENSKFPLAHVCV